MGQSRRVLRAPGITTTSHAGTSALLDDWKRNEEKLTHVASEGEHALHARDGAELVFVGGDVLEDPRAEGRVVKRTDPERSGKLRDKEVLRSTICRLLDAESERKTYVVGEVAVRTPLIDRRTARRLIQVVDVLSVLALLLLDPSKRLDVELLASSTDVYASALGE